MHETSIPWVKNPDGSQGFTANPITGCFLRCPYCYAWKLAKGRLRHLYCSNGDIAIVDPPPGYIGDSLEDPFWPRFWWKPLVEIKNRKKPAGLFLCSMGELFADWVPRSWQEAVFQTIRECPQHRFYLPTKQPQNLPKWTPFPDNCWVGVSVTSNGGMTLAMTNLANIEAGKRFISFEPLLGDIGMNDHMSMKGIIDWVIIGCQTKPVKLPPGGAVEEIIEAADKAGIPVFVKPPLSDKMNLYKQEVPR